MLDPPPYRKKSVREGQKHIGDMKGEKKNTHG